VKPLAVLTDKRVADLPDVPTIVEAGFPEATICPRACRADAGRLREADEGDRDVGHGAAVVSAS
jgi:tripartite-type tricarboxylate transporter receptor subunit TctC